MDVSIWVLGSYWVQFSLSCLGSRKGGVQKAFGPWHVSVPFRDIHRSRMEKGSDLAGANSRHKGETESA